MKSIIRKILPRISKRVNTIYRYAGVQPEEPGLPPGLEWDVASAVLIKRVFSGDEPRCGALIKLLQRGAQGIIIHDGCEWAAHGFISPPGIALPRHLHANIVQAFWWFFYMHTRPEWRRKGLQKACIQLGIGLVHKLFGQSDLIMSDTSINNIPSRRAFLRTGFEPAGIIRVQELRLPKLGIYPLYSRWSEGENHGGLPE